ncbi:MAG: helicase-associated domain-containing protein [Propionibacteriales bacterium]|nr:helicase-associated domain-containing protein [Propionibacteriales bacterium]
MASSNGSAGTLTQMLRMADDQALVDLLLNRPDLAFPPPTGLSDIASRATTRHSVAAAVDCLNAFELDMARRACGFPQGFAPEDLAATLGEGSSASPDDTASTDDIAAAVARLRKLALVWGGDGRLRPVRALVPVLWPGAADTGGVPTVLGPAPAPHPPTFPDAPRQFSGLVDKVAAGSAFEFVRRVDVLLEHCAVQPVRLRRDGVVASRQIREVGRLLDVPAAVATQHLQIAEAAGLLGVAATGSYEVLVPSADFEPWQDRSLAAQWATLAQAWRDNSAASGPAWLKQLSLTAFGDPRDGRALPVEAVRTWLAWQRPRHGTLIDRKTTSALNQATELGLLGLGAVASYAPFLDVAGLETHLPPRSDEVLLQADLTAVAPGPLAAAAARELGAIADIESRGGATVYRFSSTTLLRGAEQGWHPDAILAMLSARSRTPVPQPLVYLIRDLARANTPTEPRPERVVRVHGVARISAPDESAETRLDRAAAGATVATLRTTEDAGASDELLPARAPGQMERSPVDTLREAVETGEAVWISSADDEGRAIERTITAHSVDSGCLRGVEHRSDAPVDVPVRRITGAHILRRAT